MRFTIVLTLTIFVASLTTAATAEVRYTVTDLGSVEGFTEWIVPLALNDYGQIVGYIDNGPPGVRHAFSWENGIIQDLGTLGGEDSVAEDINNQGQIAGMAKAEDETRHSVIWQDDIIQDLGLFDGHENGAKGINESGQVVGQWYNPGGGDYAFFWDNGAWQDLDSWGTLGGTGTSVSAINDLSQITGASKASDGADYACIWENGSMQPLSSWTFPGNDNYGHDINNYGQVVGGRSTSVGEQHAFLWEDNQFKNLGNLGGRSASANSINSYGQIVGWSFDGTGPELQAFIWENNVMTNLNELIPADSGWTLIRAYDINNKGLIVGTGINTGSGEDSYRRGFLLTPIPEPSLAILLVGMLGALRLRSA